MAIARDPGQLGRGIRLALPIRRERKENPLTRVAPLGVLAVLT
jgi:hypothetical protein